MKKYMLISFLAARCRRVYSLCSSIIRWSKLRLRWELLVTIISNILQMRHTTAENPKDPLHEWFLRLLVPSISVHHRLLGVLHHRTLGCHISAREILLTILKLRDRGPFGRSEITHTLSLRWVRMVLCRIHSVLTAGWHSLRLSGGPWFWEVCVETVGGNGRLVGTHVRSMHLSLRGVRRCRMM